MIYDMNANSLYDAGAISHPGMGSAWTETSAPAGAVVGVPSGGAYVSVYRRRRFGAILAAIFLEGLRWPFVMQ